MNNKVPEFKSEEEERAFWAEAGSVGETGSGEVRTAGTGGLKLPLKTICLRLPGAMLEELRVQGNLMDVSPQSLMKTYLAERIEREMRKERSGLRNR
jgi:hypothetical protein